MDWLDTINGDKYSVVVVDGSHLMHRAAHSYKGLGFVDENGVFIDTGSIYGFLKILISIWKDYADNNCQLYICWEGGYKHRTALYPEYKANRKPSPNQTEEEFESKALFFAQQAVIREICHAAGWKQAVAPGFEADDVLATLAKTLSEQGDRVAIYTGDQDLHQCVSENIHVISAIPGGKGDKIWTPAEVLQKWGVPPSRVPEAKALAGDMGDNIPGCPGCGGGLAAKLLNSASSLSELFYKAQAGTLVGEYQGKAWKATALTERLLQNEAIVKISFELAKVVYDCPVEITQKSKNRDALRELLGEYKFRSLTEGKNFENLCLMS